MPGREKKTEKQPQKKRGGPKDDDDSSVDDHGNIRDLIVYDEESDNQSDASDLSLTESELRALKKSGKLPERMKEELRAAGRKGRGGPPPRKSAVKAGETIRRKLKKQESRRSTQSSSDSSWKPWTARQKREARDLGKSKKEIEELENRGIPFADAYAEWMAEEDSEEEDSETLGSEDSETEEEEEEKPRRRGFQPRRRRQVEEEESEEDEDESEEEEDSDDDEDEEESAGGFPGISISFGGGFGGDGPSLIPRRHNMKKESQDVRKFVKLVTKPPEDNSIDDQIDQFKALEAPKQKALLEALEHRSDYVKKEQPLMFRLLQMKLPTDTMALVMNKYNALNTMDPSTGEYYKLRAWMEKLVSMPLGLYKEMPVRIEDGPESCVPFMEKARKCLDDAIYGQEDAKLQILQFVASKIANPTASGLSLLLLGPPGIGKTSLIKNGIAKALDWPFQFISLGGDSDATTYTGHQFVYEGSHCGKIANSLAAAKSMSMVLMFDELDKISTTAKGEEVQNLLVHLTDPVQNMEFEDKYLSGIPLDMSRTMFVFSGNDIGKIDRILLDRMVVVNLAGYQVKDKIAIAEQFLMPNALREVGLCEKVAFGREVLQHILETYANEETGVRELKRCIEQIAQRINMLRMFNVKELPFHIPNFQLPFVLKREHVDLFLKKKDPKEKVPFGMYV